MPKAPTFGDLTNMALNMIGFEADKGFSMNGVKCDACRWGTFVFRNTIGSAISRDLIVEFA